MISKHVCLLIIFYTPFQAYFSNKIYPLTNQTHHTQIIGSIHLIEKKSGFIKIIGVQNK